MPARLALVLGATAVLVFAPPVAAQIASPPGLPAIDVPASVIQAFYDTLPKDRISDLPIRTANAGTHRVLVYGAFRPQHMPGPPILHRLQMSEIYYVLEGAGTLVTGGTMTGVQNEDVVSPRGTVIEDGVSRRIGPGDIVIIPGGVPHWWSSLESDIKYLILRPDPASR
jgi:mannose-6-phosphate isomerase-like protein (cupin superfamily)